MSHVGQCPYILVCVCVCACLCSIPFPPAAAGRPRLLDAYIAATQGGVQAREPQQPQPQQQQAVPERLHDARGSELTLGHVIAKVRSCVRAHRHMALMPV